MKHLSWKTPTAVLTFFIGTGLAALWFSAESKFFQIPVLPPPVELQTMSAGSEKDFIETPDAAPLMTFTESESLDGRRDALRDVKKGELIILVRGSTRFQIILEEELAGRKIKVESIGCFFDRKDELYLGGYNEVSKAAINKRFGEEFIEKAISKADEREKGHSANK